MSVLDQLQADLRQAMLDRDEVRRSTLRMALSAIHNRQIELRREPNEGEVIEIIGRQVKQRHESIVAFRAGDREQMAQAEEAEAKILQAYLPAQVESAEVERIVSEAIAASGASSPQEMGKVMALVMPQLKGRADGKLISETARRLLG